MKRAFKVRDPAGPRWEQALELLGSGHRPVLLDGRLAIARVPNDNGGRGRLRITVLNRSGSGPSSRAEGQREVDSVSAPFLRLVIVDEQLRSALHSSDVTWEYAEDVRGDRS